MVYFDPQRYQSFLFEEREKLTQRAHELKLKIGQEEGAAQSWSRPAQKAMEQDLEVVLAQLEGVERKIREFESLAKKTRTPQGKVSLGSVITVRADGREEVFMIAETGDPQFGILSAHSPVGQALMGKARGARVKVSASGAASEWEILKVETIGN